MCANILTNQPDPEKVFLPNRTVNDWSASNEEAVASLLQTLNELKSDLSPPTSQVRKILMYSDVQLCFVVLQHVLLRACFSQICNASKDHKLCDVCCSFFMHPETVVFHQNAKYFSKSTTVVYSLRWAVVTQVCSIADILQKPRDYQRPRSGLLVQNT